MIETMTQPTHLIGSTYGLPIPEDAHGIDINKYANGSELNYWLISGDKETLIVIDLPPGNWQLICTTKEVTEEQAKGIVEREEGEFKDYECDEAVYMYAANSLRSLLTSKGLDPNKNYLLIKKVS